MKEQIQWKRLVAYLLTSAAMALLSRLLMVEPGWKTVVIAVLCSVLLYPLISVFLFKKNRRVFNISRLVLVGLILLAGYLYYSTWDSRVCTVIEVRKDGNKSSNSKKNIIIGTKLKDESDPDVIQFQKEHKYNEIIDIYQTHDASAIWTDGSIESSRRLLNISLISLVVLVSLLGMHTVEFLLFRPTNNEPPDKQVFISYNHENKNEAARLTELLRKHDIGVVRDEVNMPVGEDINVFIKNSIKSSAITLMVVSKESLLSGWVATETITSFFLSDFDESRGCIACYLDNSFRKAGFGNIALQQVNEKLGVIQQEIRNRDELHEDSKELNDQKTRLYRLKNNLDTILQRLQNSKCVDIAGEKLEQNFPLILESIKQKFDR